MGEARGRPERIIEVIGGLLGLVLMVDAATGGQLQAWARARITRAFQSKDPDRREPFGGIAAEAERITRAAVDEGSTT